VTDSFMSPWFSNHSNYRRNLFLSSSQLLFHDVCLFQVSGVGVQNPYRIRPFLGAKVPVNSSFSPVISMYNPHGSVLQVC